MCYAAFRRASALQRSDGLHEVCMTLYGHTGLRAEHARRSHAASPLESRDAGPQGHSAEQLRMIGSGPHRNVLHHTGGRSSG